MSAEKGILRERLREEPIFAPPSGRVETDRHICQMLEEMPEISRAGCIALYSAVDHEPDMSPLATNLMDKGTARLCFPRRVKGSADGCSYEMAVISNRSELCRACLGIPEPAESCPSVSSENIDAWIVPGMAFDLKGYRLGRGRGIYDRLLAKSPGTRVGVSYSSRVLPHIPHCCHDVRMDRIITEKGIVFSLIDSEDLKYSSSTCHGSYN
ncbi:MAG: 5-formyltetrahydrofolate cyclo-ligase [Victivallales bacterium]|nr:5-formyltetrahydrofolate cyclo-ligase [Victivallales bacterium]